MFNPFLLENRPPKWYPFLRNQERRSINNMMELNWSLLADLEDLIYENQSMVISER